MVIRVGSSQRGKRGDEPIRREGLQARGIYKEVPRPSRGLALATTKRSLIFTQFSYTIKLIESYIEAPNRRSVVFPIIR